jgi:hypothetical protein
MAIKKIKIFIEQTIEIFKFWVDLAVKPLFSDDEGEGTPAPEQLGVTDDDQAISLGAAFGGEISVDYTDTDYESNRIIFVSFPWGQIVPVPFSGDQWKMVHEIAAESGDEVPDVIEDIVAQRHDIIMTMRETLGQNGGGHGFIDEWPDDLDDWN